MQYESNPGTAFTMKEAWKEKGQVSIDGKGRNRCAYGCMLYATAIRSRELLESLRKEPCTTLRALRVPAPTRSRRRPVCKNCSSEHQQFSNINSKSQVRQVLPVG